MSQEKTIGYRFKNVLSTLVIILIIVGIVIVFVQLSNWPIRFSSELDKFFGKGNWLCIGQETNTSRIYEEYNMFGDPLYNDSTPGKYINWCIRFADKNGEEVDRIISDHTYRINKSKYSLLSGKRYSMKQVLMLELMHISFELVSKELCNELFSNSLSEQEADCIQIALSYHGGNPKSKFFNHLCGESWFTVADATVENYLECELHDFYILIRVHDYLFKKLTNEQKERVQVRLKEVEDILLDRYGKYASFEIYFGEESGLKSVEYLDGVLLEN